MGLQKSLIVILLLLSSCGSKKIVTQTKEIIKNDTIIITKDRVITKAIVDSIIIKEPCDSLGILKPFKQRLKTDRGTITIENRNNSIEAIINLDSIVQSVEKQYKSNVTKTVSDNKTEIIKYRIPSWIIVSLVVSILLNVILVRVKI
jgi:hypothetical protein